MGMMLFPSIHDTLHTSTSFERAEDYLRKVKRPERDATSLKEAETIIDHTEKPCL